MATEFLASEIQTKVRDEIQLELTEDQAEKLARFTSLLLRWNNAYNLTSIKNPEDVVRLHIADSLTLVQHFTDLVGEVKNVLDVGSGEAFRQFLWRSCVLIYRLRWLTLFRRKRFFRSRLVSRAGCPMWSPFMHVLKR